MIIAIVSIIKGFAMAGTKSEWDALINSGKTIGGITMQSIKDAVDEHGSINKAAPHIGISKTRLYDLLKSARNCDIARGVETLDDNQKAGVPEAHLSSGLSTLYIYPDDDPLDRMYRLSHPRLQSNLLKII